MAVSPLGLAEPLRVAPVEVTELAAPVVTPGAEGVVNSVIFGGIMTMLVVGVTAKKADQLVKLEKVG